MEHSFSVLERLQLLNILPAQGDILTLRIVSELRTALSFSEDEIAQLKLTQEGDQIHWDTGAECPKEINIGKRGLEIVQKRLEQLSKDGKLQLAYIPLYDRFVEEDQCPSLLAS